MTGHDMASLDCDRDTIHPWVLALAGNPYNLGTRLSLVTRITRYRVTRLYTLLQQIPGNQIPGNQVRLFTWLLRGTFFHLNNPILVLANAFACAC